MSRRNRYIEIPPRSSDSGPSETKRRKAPDSDDPLASMASTTCQKCTRVTIGENCSCFVLGCEPKCRVCANCFSQMVLCLAKTSIMTCPCCESIIHSWDTVCPQVYERRSGLKIVMQETNFELPVISPKLDPIRFHANMPSPEARDKLVGISVTSSTDGVVCSLSEPFLLDSDCNEWGSAQLGLLEYLFKILHTLLITSDSTRGRTDYDVTDNATPEALRWFIANDLSPLHRMIYALACGVSLGDLAEVEAD